MNSNINKVELVLRKINYLFESLDPNQVNPSSLEIALLKRYAVDLYDNILQYEESNNHIEEKPFNFLNEQDTAIESNFTNNVGEINPYSAEHDIKDVKDEVTEDLTNILAEVKRKNNFETEEKEVERDEDSVEGVNNAFDWELPEEESTETVFNEVNEYEAVDDYEVPQFEAPQFNDSKFESVPEKEEPVAKEEPYILNRLANKFPEIEPEKSTPPPKVFDILQENLNNPDPVVKPQTNNNFVDTAKTDVLTNIAFKLKRDQDRIIKNDEPKKAPQQTLNDKIVNDKAEPKNLMDRLRTAGNSRKKFNISYNQRFGFVRDLFGGDGGTYEGTLNELGKCKNVIEAFTYINLHVKMKYHWKDESPTVKEFQQVIKDYFLND